MGGMLKSDELAMASEAKTISMEERDIAYFFEMDLIFSGLTGLRLPIVDNS